MIEKIGIIGAGQMGNGIAHVAAVAGVSVVLLDLDQQRIERRLETITQNLARQVRRNLLSESEDRLRSIAFRRPSTTRILANATWSSKPRPKTRRLSGRYSRR